MGLFGVRAGEMAPPSPSSEIVAHRGPKQGTSVERFLKDARDFTPIEVKTLYPGTGEREGPWLRLGPRSDGTDGFFIAVLRKRNENG